MIKNLKGPDEIPCDGVETAIKFSYRDDKLNGTDGCKTAVTAGTRIGWIKFRKCIEIFKSQRSSSKMKVYKSCVRSAMLYGSETSCVREKRRQLEKNKKAMIRAMCGVKLLDRRNSEEFMDMLSSRSFSIGWLKQEGCGSTVMF